jgi:hypothetical protein
MNLWLILLSLMVCPVAMTGPAAAAATAKQSAHVKRITHPETSVYPLSTDAIVGYKGCVFGAAADSRERALLNQIGLPH